MHHLIDLGRYPLDAPHSVAWQDLVAECKAELTQNGLFNLPAFLRPDAIAAAVAELSPLLANAAFSHVRRHNIYFQKSLDDLPATHPALQECETAHSTVCADQIPQSVVVQLYEWPPFAAFLSAVMDRPRLFTMDDPLARVNVMGYAQGQTLNWHFDRSEFTTTLLLQAPEGGGAFEYDKDLRSDTDPNYDEVADLLEGRRIPVRMPLTAGTLNVFKGKNTAHRVTPVQGARDRIIAVFSYYERAGVTFTPEERLGFYGRAS